MDALVDRLQASLGDAFAIERELGGGGMSRVFVARERALDRQVVIKALDLELSAHASAERFRREVRLIATLQHPHIVSLLTAGGNETLLWYAMPFISGESLRARLTREGALPLADTMRIAREVLDALGFAHDRGIAHRDVKPDNILLEGKHAVVADFGIAKALADAGVGTGLTTAGAAIGTPAYMAPEQAMADVTTNHRADLYATGAVLYEMLVGAPPYSGNAQSVVAAHLTAPVPDVTDRRRDVPSGLARLIERLLAKNPAERPQSAHDALAALDAAVTPVPTAAASGADSLTRRMPNAVSPGRVRRTAGVVAALVAVGAAGTWVSRRASSAPVASGADVIAVMPLGSTGDTTLARIGRDLVVTVSANLDGVGAVRTVDPMSVIVRADRLPRPLPLADAAELARELGAGSVLHGTLVRDGGLVRADVTLSPVVGGDPLARVRVSAPLDSVRTLTDLLTNNVLQQVWRHGRAPSSVLSEVTTRSNEALRAFLEGEAHFQRFAWDTAAADFARAIAADSTFAQAYVRLDYVRAWGLEPPDTAVRRHLIAVMSRLPARDRELLSLRFASLTLKQRIDSGLALAARYQDFPTAQLEAADPIIHYGPIVGVPITRALPYIDRIDVIAPSHSDNAFHRLLIANAVGDTTMILAAARNLATSGSGFPADHARAHVTAYEALASGRPRPSAATALEYLHRVAPALRSPSLIGGIPRLYLFPLASPAAVDSGLSTAIADGSFGDAEPLAIAARASLSVARGDFAGGVALFGTSDTPRRPAFFRVAPARVAATASWLGMLPPAVADSMLRRTRALVGASDREATIEMAWLDGLIGVAAGDSARVVRAAATLPSADATVGRLAMSLGMLWRERRSGETDRLRALEDSAMAGSGMPRYTLPVVRLAIGRGLVRSGDAAAAERYLQWTDAASTDGIVAPLQIAFGPINSYHRALAFAAANDRHRAIMHFERFLRAVDSPATPLTPQIEDARARLARLLGNAQR